MAKDPYSVLGVPRDASQEDIKKSYRKLSKEWHPDKHKGEKNAETRFKEINEAYEVLGDEEKRRNYDQFGSTGAHRSAGAGFDPNNFDFSAFQRGFGGGDTGDLGDLFGSFFGGRGGARRPRTQGEDIGAQLDISLREAFTGFERTLSLRKPLRCETCSGSGAAEGSRLQQCGTCSGTGQVTKMARSFFGTIRQTVPCADCDGTGERPEKPCRTCGGEGRVTGVEEVTIRIPAGIATGQALRVQGKGGAGLRGDASGDLGIAINVRPDAQFTREGDDIRTMLELGIPDATLGAELSVETLHGPVKLRIPEGAQPGDVLRIRGKGMPVLNTHRFGDHYVHVHVVIPKKLSRTERKLMEEWRGMKD